MEISSSVLSELQSDLFSASFDIQNEDPFTPSFERVGRSGLYLQWTLPQHTEFVEWWLSTEWAVKAVATSGGSLDLVKKISWDSKARTSETWKSFHQAANRLTGEPVLVCRNCGTALAHPNYKASGTKSMRNHISTIICQQAKRSERSEQSLLSRKDRDQQTSIQAAFSNTVSPV